MYMIGNALLCLLAAATGLHNRFLKVLTWRIKYRDAEIYLQ
jgi:hypothetical protein